MSIAHGCSLGSGVQIDAYTYINSYTEVSSGLIGKFCSIAGFCMIGSNNHPTDWISTSPNLYSIIEMIGNKGYCEIKNAPIIGNDVWIGAHSVILKGVIVGDGAIVAAGSNVTKDIPPYAIVGGVPAKIIKYRFGKETIDKLLTIKWWNKNEKELPDFKNVIEKEREFYRYL